MKMISYMDTFQFKHVIQTILNVFVCVLSETILITLRIYAYTFLTRIPQSQIMIDWLLISKSSRKLNHVFFIKNLNLLLNFKIFSTYECVEARKRSKPIINSLVTLKNGVTINYSTHLQKVIGFQCVQQVNRCYGILSTKKINEVQLNISKYRNSIHKNFLKFGTKVLQ